MTQQPKTYKDEGTLAINPTEEGALNQLVDDVVGKVIHRLNGDFPPNGKDQKHNLDVKLTLKAMSAKGTPSWVTTITVSQVPVSDYASAKRLIEPQVGPTVAGMLRQAIKQISNTGRQNFRLVVEMTPKG